MCKFLALFLLLMSTAFADYDPGLCPQSGGGSNGITGLSVGTVPVGTSPTTVSASSIIVSGSNVGISSAAPRGTLDVAGNIYFTGLLGTTISGIQGTGPNILTGTGSYTNGDGLKIDSAGRVIDSGAAYNAGGGALSGLTVNYVPVADSASTVTNSPISIVNGNVGIGSVTPGQLLDIQGSIRAAYFTGNGAGLTGISGSVSGLTTNNIPKAASATTLTPGTITDTGNIGIGSAIPTAKLDVGGTINASTAYTLNGSGSMRVASANNIQFDGNHSTFTTAGMTLVGSNVGIGTVTAGKLLTLGSTGQATIDSSGNLMTSGNIGISTAVAGQALVVNGNVVISGTCTAGGGSCGGGGSSQWNTSGSTINYVAGNVGIGSAVPGQVLDVFGAGANIRVVASSGDAVFNVTNGANVGIADMQSTGNFLIDNKSNNGISFATNDTTRMTLSNTGNLGIGSTTPTALGGGRELNIIENSSSGLSGFYMSSTTGTMIGRIVADTTIKTPALDFMDNHSGTDVDMGGAYVERTTPLTTGATRNTLVINSSVNATALALATNGTVRVIISNTGTITLGTGASHVSTTYCGTSAGTLGYCSGGLAAVCGTCTAL